MRYIKIEYLINDEIENKLNELLPKYQSFTKDGKQPFKDWTIENLFQFIMNVGCFEDINKKIDYMNIF